MADKRPYFIDHVHIYIMFSGASQYSPLPLGPSILMHFLNTTKFEKVYAF